MSIRTEKHELRIKLKKLSKELKSEEPNIYDIDNLIAKIREMCKNIDKQSTADSAKILTSRGYDLINKASEQVVKIMGY